MTAVLRFGLRPASSDDPPAFEDVGMPGPVTASPRVTLDAVRVVAWNVESVGGPGTQLFGGAHLATLDAELVR